jgi:hypothetical protein
MPPVKMAVAVHAGAVHAPGGGVVGGLVGGDVGGVAPANCVVNFVKSHAPWATLEHVPDVVPLLSGGVHCRSRLTDQYV